MTKQISNTGTSRDDPGLFGVFLNDWSESKLIGVMSGFEIKYQDLKGKSILLASYENEDYEGYAYVLLTDGVNLFEVHGSHCSCYGLEEQWDIEETTAESILKRVKDGDLGEEGDFGKALIKIVIDHQLRLSEVTA